MIKSKEQIIKYFKSGIKQTNDFRIGIEHEKFLFDNHNNKRIGYSKIKETKPLRPHPNVCRSINRAGIRSRLV